MANTIRIKRRASGAAGAPAALENAELAFNEVDNVLWYGKGTGGANGTATNIIAIGGDGAYLNLSGTQTITGTKTFTGEVNLSGATVSGFTTTGGVVIGGDLTVNGTTTTINSVTISTDDKNIELGATESPTDASADAGGITLKGTTDKTINWLDATDAWTFSEHVDLAAGKSYYINGSAVLSATALGSGVTGSSLTSVGTLTSGIWQAGVISTAYGGTGQHSYLDGEILIGTSTTGGLAKATLTGGDGTTVTNGNGSITISADLKTNGGLVIESGQVAVDLGASAITGTLAIGDGGTGATDASTARANLGLAIGSDAQAWDADLDTLSGMQTGAAAAVAALTATEVAVIDGSTAATATTLALSDRMVINDAGSMVQVALSDLITFLENGAVSGFDINGGTY
jgi:hypothetical protein